MRKSVIINNNLILLLFINLSETIYIHILDVIIPNI